MNQFSLSPSKGIIEYFLYTDFELGLNSQAIMQNHDKATIIVSTWKNNSQKASDILKIP